MGTGSVIIVFVSSSWFVQPGRRIKLKEKRIEINRYGRPDSFTFPPSAECIKEEKSYHMNAI